MPSLLVDEQEQRDVATTDIAGAFLLADMDDFVLLKLRGEELDITSRVNTEYEKYITYEKGRKVLYMKLIKALYGCIMLALLWYRTFVEYLEGIGFQLNPYDPCVAIVDINGLQCTICWYVDDTKISHRDPEAVTWLVQKNKTKVWKNDSGSW